MQKRLRSFRKWEISERTVVPDCPRRIVLLNEERETRGGRHRAAGGIDYHIISSGGSANTGRRSMVVAPASSSTAWSQSYQYRQQQNSRAKPSYWRPGEHH